MSPKIIKTDEQGGKLFFTCCADNETFPNLWWYTENTTIAAIDTQDHRFKIHVETSLHENPGQGGVVTRKRRLFSSAEEKRKMY